MMNQAQLENGALKQIVTHFERDLELNGLESPDELQVKTVSQYATNTNPDKPEPTHHHCKNLNVTETNAGS